MALGLWNPPATPDFSKVRIGWQTEGQPAQTIDQDVAYLRCIEDDDNYNRVRHERSIVLNDTSIIQEYRYTRVWKTLWTVYGPNSFDACRKIKSAIVTSWPVHDLLAGANLYAITDMRAPVRAPENFSGQWWDRVDFEARFNELVIEQQTVQTVKSVEVIGETEAGTVFDITVTGE